jgi:hypothetical protein
MNKIAMMRIVDISSLKRGNDAGNFPTAGVLNLTLSFQANLNG